MAAHFGNFLLIVALLIGICTVSAVATYLMTRIG